jgi:Xaa-Pro aminopeptidase
MTEVSFLPVGINREKLAALLKEAGLQGLFFSSPENVFYTTGYPCLPGSGNPIIHALRNQLPYFSYAGSDGRMTLLAWAQASMGIDYGAEDVRSWFTFPMAVDELTAFIQETLPPGSAIGVDSTFPFFLAKILQEQGIKLQDADGLVHKLQMVKTAAEIERIRRSTAIIDQTVLELADCLHPGMTRLELIREAKARMLANGAEGVDHVTVAFGPANPEIALDEAIEPDQIVTLDLGAVYAGYVSDNRRLVYTGSVPPDLAELHKKLCWIVAEMGRALLPGKTFGGMNAFAYELYAKVGLDPMFLHVGHSLGLHVDEHWLLPDDPTVIEKDMVLNIELYSLSDQGVMIGDEETFVVTGDEPEKLSSLPVDIIERKIFKLD